MHHTARQGKKLTVLFQKFIFDANGTLHFSIELLILLGLTAIAHGLFATKLGFYWDNWGFAWVRNFRDSHATLEIFSGLRPLQGYFEAMLTYLLGVNPIAWQLFSLLTRWLAIVAFWWFLNQFWPANRQMNFVATLLFLVYPGYTQQPLAQGYPYVWVFESLFFVSLVWMVKAVHGLKSSFLMMVGAVVLSFLTLFSIEYLFGLELIRPVLIWLALRAQISNPKKRLVRTLQYYAPFVFTLGVYLYWRFGIFTQAVYQPVLLGEMQKGPVHAILSLGQTVLGTIVTVSVQAWVKAFQLPPMGAFSTTLWAVYIFSVLGIFLGISCFLIRLSNKNDSVIRPLFRQWIFIGLISIILVGIPYYVAGLPIHLYFPDDHYTLPFMFGVSLFLAGVIGLFPNRVQGVTLASILVALAVGNHIYTNNQYRAERQIQQTFIWQLTWRAPALRPGTVIITEDMDTFPYDDDEALGYAINWAYHPENKSGRIYYTYLFVSARLGNAIPALEPAQPVIFDHPFEKFESTTDQMILLEYSPPSCLHILTQATDGDRISLMLDSEMPWRRDKTDMRLLPELALAALPLSNPDQIIVNPPSAARPPESLFGPEPAHRWCYYYEKADLARQTGDWEKVVQVADEVFAIPYYPDNYYEYLLFIDGYVRLHRWDEAQMLTNKVAETGPVLRPALCAIWQHAEQSTEISEEDGGLIRNVINELGVCSSP